MTVLVLAAAVLAAVLGYSPVPVFVSGAIIVVSMGYWMSQHITLLRLGATFALFAIMHFIGKEMIPAFRAEGISGAEIELLEFFTSDMLVMLLAGIVMLLSTMIGTARNSKGA